MIGQLSKANHSDIKASPGAGAAFLSLTTILAVKAGVPTDIPAVFLSAEVDLPGKRMSLFRRACGT
jgi:hypothetical protein